MSVPSITSITFDKASYTPGELITVTITGIFTGTAALTATLTGDGVSVADFLIQEVLAVKDSGSRVWTQVTLTSTVAVFTATA
jgi:uncharacterized protein YfaS (alpha-2-macroglobulin family)